jgi:uridine phosphorylase
MNTGDLAVISGAIRDEGTSSHYLPMEFPAVADLDVVLAMRDAARERKMPHRVGVAQSKDSFYGEVEPGRMPIASDLERRWKAWIAGGAISSEMESATLFIVAATLRARAGGIMVCFGSPSMSPEESEAQAKNFSIDPVIDTAVHGLRLLIARDRAAGA